MAFFSCLKCFTKAEEEEITELDYAHQSLNDVPNEVFAYERTLEKMVLDCNNIRDLPRQLFHCEGLRSLSVADNDVHVLPPAVSSLSSLTYLNLSKNVLTDIPDSIKQCKQLAILDASVNPLQKIPEGCTQLLSITELYLNDTFLEFLPANFGRLSKLKILELRENGLNTLPKSLCRLVNLERLDLGQNEISEVPEVVGALTALKELWLDGNKIKGLPNIIGNLKSLHHLEVSMNRIDYVSDTIQNCKVLTDLGMSTNDLKTLPEAIGGLESLVTLKLDDNQLNELPLAIGRLKNLEELVVSQNYLEALPPSIGLCRKLHTLNVDDNDIEYLPKELGSCKSLRILSAHGNRLTTLPAEIDHITNLAVINLTANMIQHLPVSLMKLNNITAIWLSENQHKPLVQLNQDTDPETGQKVLTNFLLPQQNQDDPHDNQSESGSFHALAWEEERSRRSQVKWAGDYQHPEDVAPSGMTSLRREPTPFPKEMRAMAKRVQNLRNKKVHSGGGGDQVPADDLMQQKKRRRASLEISNDQDHHVQAGEQLSVSDSPSVEVKEAKVFNLPSPTSAEVNELKQFEDFEQAILGGEDSSNCNVAVHQGSPDKTSRDSGVITPSDASTSDQDPGGPGSITCRNPSDPLPQAPVKAEIVTNELLDNNGEAANNSDNNVNLNNKKPPPYHIAAQMSKHANDFQNLERKSSFMSDATLESISAGSETSTAPSSLQTIVSRAPINNNNNNNNTNGNNGSNHGTEGGNSETDSVYNHANNLRKVSEQMLFGAGSARSRASFTGIPRPNSTKPSPLISNVAGSEMRPSSYAGPHNTVGLPVLSPAIRMNTTLPTSSATSTLERPPTSGLRPPSSTQLSSKLRRPSLDSSLMSLQPAGGPPLKKSPPPAVPLLLNLRPKNNGLLTTIEQAALSDEEPGSPVQVTPQQQQRPSSVQGGSSRIPTPNSQPNYENVTNRKISDSPINSSTMIPMLAKKTSLPTDRLSTANFVATSPPIKKGSDIQMRSFIGSPASGASPASVSSRLPSKIPTPGSHQVQK
jgi:Leucine-rich repeat (LRR) protein